MSVAARGPNFSHSANLWQTRIFALIEWGECWVRRRHRLPFLRHDADGSSAV